MDFLPQRSRLYAEIERGFGDVHFSSHGRRLTLVLFRVNKFANDEVVWVFNHLTTATASNGGLPIWLRSEYFIACHALESS